MALRSVIKQILGWDEGEAERCRLLVQQLQRKPGRGRCVIEADDGDLFIAFTDCGWWHLEVAGWGSGVKEWRKYVISVEALDPEIQEAARESLASATAESLERQKHAAAVELGRLGGKLGGKARAAKLSPERRHEIAVQAARARWGQ